MPSCPADRPQSSRDQSSGIEPRIRAPWPGSDSHRTVPPIAPSRSAMLMNPWPPPRPRGVEARSVVADREQQPPGLLPDPHRHPRLRCVLGGVLQRLQAAEVDRRLDLGRVPPDAVGAHGDGQRAAVARGPERLSQPAVDEQRRVDAVRQLAQLLDGLLDILGQLVQHLSRGRGIVGDDVPGQAQVHRHRHQVLLGAVVQVALHPAALRVAAGDDPGPGPAQLLGLPAQLVEGGLEVGVELGVVEREAHLPGQIGEHPVVVLGERVGPAGRSTTMSPSSSPAWLTGATRSWLGRARPAPRGSQTDAQALPDTPARATTGRSLRRDHDRAAAQCRAPRRPAPARRRLRCRPRRWSGPSSCGATPPAAAAARPSGWPSSAGCRTCAAPRRAPAGPRRRTGSPRRRAAHGPAGSRPRPPPRRASRARVPARSPASLGAVPDAEHDHEVDGGDHDGESGYRQQPGRARGPRRAQPATRPAIMPSGEERSRSRPRPRRSGPASGPVRAAPRRPARCRRRPRAPTAIHWSRSRSRADAPR